VLDRATGAQATRAAPDDVFVTHLPGRLPRWGRGSRSYNHVSLKFHTNSRGGHTRSGLAGICSRVFISISSEPCAARLTGGAACLPCSSRRPARCNGVPTTFLPTPSDNDRSRQLTKLGKRTTPPPKVTRVSANTWMKTAAPATAARSAGRGGCYASRSARSSVPCQLLSSLALFAAVRLRRVSPCPGFNRGRRNLT
jgi:hypothetical protein